MATRHPGDLEMAREADVRLDSFGQVSLEHLHVIDVEVQVQIAASDLLQDSPRVFGVIEK